MTYHILDTKEHNMFNSNNDTLRQILVISGLSMVLTVNGLANALPINGLRTADVTEGLEVLFSPAAYVFAVWGAIYSFQAAYVVYQALPSQKTNPLHRRIAPWYLLISLANTTWIFLWHYQQFGLSNFAMITLLVGLSMLYLITREGGERPTRAHLWLLRVPFSLYLAWITVATVVNVTQWLNWIQWGRFGIGELTWGLTMLLVATLIASLMAWRFRDIAYVCVIVWAFIGIAVRQNETLPMAITAGVMAAVVIATLVLGMLGHSAQHTLVK
jgi:hypothetical protein